MPGEFCNFSKKLNNLAIDPREIKAVVVTHCHWDHIGGLKEIKDATGAKILVQKHEKEVLENGARTTPKGVTLWGKILAGLLSEWSKKIPIRPSKVDVVIGEENMSLEDYGINGKIVFTPGHSAGSVSVVLDSGEAFVADMAMNGFPLTLKPDLPIFADDIAEVRNSWKKLIDMGVTEIYPAHGKSFPVEKIKKKI